MPNTIDDVITIYDRYAKGEIKKIPEDITTKCIEIQQQETTNPSVEVFTHFLDRLIESGITDPALIPLKRHEKSPDVSRGGKILNTDKTAVNEQYRLNRESAIEWMRAGNNVGIYGTPDTLLFLDADLERGRLVYPDDKYQELVESQDTLTVRTRSGGGLLIFKSDGSKGNPHHYFDSVDAGEIRRDWQYVVCPGSFIPKYRSFKANDTKGHTAAATGYYEIVRDAPIRTFNPDRLPGWFRMGKVDEKIPILKTNSPVVTPSRPVNTIDFENKFGRSLTQIRQEYKALDTALSGITPGEDRSAMDFNVCMILLRYHFDFSSIASILTKFRPYEKTERADYIQNTVLKAYKKHEENHKEYGNMIQTNNKFLAEKSDDALAALIEMNRNPTMFLRGGSLVYVRHDEEMVPRVETMGERDIRHRLTRCARFFEKRIKKGEKGEEKPVWIRVDPPVSIAQDIMVHPKMPEYFPGLISVTCVPIVHPDGSVFTVPGYDHESKNYYSPVSIDAITVPDSPTDEDIKNSRELLEEIIEAFPFYDEDGSTGASKANTLGLFITAVARPLIGGTIPLHLIDKPLRGTGASLLCEVLHAIATGSPAEVTTPPVKEEEWKKVITTKIVSGSSLNIFDNVEGKLSSASLSSVITTPVWKDRVLGKNTEENVYPTTGIMWVANGNNIILGGDIARRCVWIRMDAKTPRPWERNADFRHGRGDVFIQWVMENRGKILSAIITLIRGWILRGQPEPENQHIIGGFEAWSRVIGGILDTAGVSGFLGNLDEMYDNSDVDTQEWSNFAATWHDYLKDDSYTGRDILDLMKTLATEDPRRYEKGSALLDALPSELSEAYSRKGDTFTKSLGRALKRKKEVRYLVDNNVYRFTTNKSINRAICWKVIAESV